MSKVLKLHLPKPTGTLSFNGVDPLDGRYYDAEVAHYLSERSRVAFQSYVEAALAYTLAQYGMCTNAHAAEIEKAATQVTIEEVYAEEQTTKHDIKALVNCLKKKVSPGAATYVHYGATSYDIISTAQALQLRTAAQEVILPRLKALLNTLITLATQHANTVQIGRTHGQHALPITFGFALSEYISRLGQSTVAIQALSEELVGKFAGAVGSYNALSIFVENPLQFEKDMLARVGLQPAEHATQIVPPEPTVRLIDELTIAAQIMSNLAHDMRHLQRSEIGEIKERFEKGQTGSSTMAHKRNPWNFENVISIGKQVMAQSLNANLNLSSEHQRDLTDSASSRFYPVALASVASMTARLNKVMSKIEVDTNNMQRNLEMSGGAIAAEPLYLLLAKYGHPKAHEKAKELAHLALEQGNTLATAIHADTKATRYWSKFSAHEQQIIEQPARYYTGLASKKTLLLCQKWHNMLNRR